MLWVQRVFGFSLLPLFVLPAVVSAFSAPMASSTDTTTSSNTLGANALRHLVAEAAAHDTESTLDVTGILWLEHINLVVGSKPLAQQFYLDILGFSADKSKSFHVNLGQQQFHLAETGDPAQKVTGSIGLVVPSIATVKQRLREALERNGDVWKDTQLKVVEETKDTLTLTCPWGNCLHLYDAQMEVNSLEPTLNTPQKMVNLHAPGGTYAPERMSVRGNPGIRYIEIACRPDSAAKIANFYTSLVGCTVSTPSSDQAVVCVGPGVHLVYQESDTVTDEDFQAMQGVHLCIYVANFKALYDTLSDQNLVWTNPRFTHLDSCDTWEEALASRTLRFKDLICTKTGDKVLELEHETRPLRHGQYLKVPFYEPK